MKITPDELRMLADRLAEQDMYGSDEMSRHDDCTGAIHQAADEIEKLHAALTRIRDYPNGPLCHSDMCELHDQDPMEDGEETCDCGYWAENFPQLKIEAMKALTP